MRCSPKESRHSFKSKELAAVIVLYLDNLLITFLKSYFVHLITSLRYNIKYLSTRSQMPRKIQSAPLQRSKNNKDDDSEPESIIKLKPKSSFQSYAAEADILQKQGDFRKAIEIYTKVFLI